MTTNQRKETKATGRGPSPHSRSVPSAGYRGEVRIIGGALKRSRLSVSERPGLRPTPSRVRETAFDWLTHLLGGLEGKNFLDMFAGSGALGLEAASRGAASVLSIEKDKATARSIAEDVKRLGVGDVVEVVCADAFDYLRRTDAKFDVVFIDPPFASQLQAEALGTVRNHLEKGALVFLESDTEIDENLVNTDIYVVLRRGKAGVVKYLILSVVD